jgi:hypothetical protein
MRGCLAADAQNREETVPQTTTCPNCFKQFAARTEAIGRRVKCSKCAQPFVVTLDQELDEPPMIDDLAAAVPATAPGWMPAPVQSPPVAASIRLNPRLVWGAGGTVALLAAALAVYLVWPRSEAKLASNAADSVQYRNSVAAEDSARRAMIENRLRQIAGLLTQYAAIHDGHYPPRMEDAFNRQFGTDFAEERLRYHYSIEYLGKSTWTAPLPPEIMLLYSMEPPNQTVLFGDGHIETADMNQWANSPKLQAASHAQARFSQQSAPIAQRNSVGGGTLAFPSFGVTCPLPAGWQRTSEAAETQVFQIANIQGLAPSPDGVIRLEVGPRTNSGNLPTLQSYAEFVANNQKMRVNDEAVTLGGLPAKEITALADPPVGRSGLVRGRVIEHAGYYMGLYQVAGPGAPRVVFDAIASELSWSDPKPPADALASGARIRVLWLQGAGLLCDLPDPFRVSQMSPQKVRCITYDLTTHALDAALTISYVPDASGDMGQYKDRAMELAGGKEVFARAPTWTDLPGPVAVSYTGVLSTQGSQRSKQLMLARSADHRLAILVFDYQEQTAERYAGVMKNWLVGSFRSSRAYEESRASVPQPAAPK